MGRLWAITCLFNPAGYQARNENYRIFREDFTLPLVTVELSFGSKFALSGSDADILIQIQGGDRMWQKERLLNIALQALPSECDQVLWIDADIVISNLQRWTGQIRKGLEDHSVVQAFSSVNMLDPRGNAVLQNPSTVAALQTTRNSDNLFATTLDRSKGAPCSGHAWAARREVLSERGLYDGCIVGGGDTAFLCAATGDYEKAIQMHRMGGAQRDRYLNWATQINKRITKGVGFVDFTIDHLWHGSIENRQGGQRHVDLSEIGFDPYTDIALDNSQIWRWATDRPELHRYVRDYFVARQEDEAGVLTS